MTQGDKRTDSRPESDTEFHGFTSPAYNGSCIANIPDTAAKLLGLRANRPIAYEEVSEFGEKTENVILILLDGLGFDQVNQAKKRLGLPSLDRIATHSKMLPITSVFPSTTATAMTSLHSGLTPQEHGVIGYTMYLRELGAIAQMLRFVPVHSGRTLFDLGIEAKGFLGGKTIHERLTEEGINSAVYLPSYISDTGLSRVTNRGAKVEPHNGVSDMLVLLRKNLERSAGRAFSFAYHPSPDTLSHARGPYSEAYGVELESVFRLVDSELFRKLDRGVAKKTVVMISGDHGAVHVDRDRVIDLADHQGLLRMLKLPPTGDSRALILHVMEGEEDEVKKYFEEHWPGLFEVRKSRSMLDEGFFGIGRIKQETYDRVGDLVVLPKFRNAVDNSTLDPHHENIPGRHGGMSGEEMNVPLILARVA